MCECLTGGEYCQEMELGAAFFPKREEKIACMLERRSRLISSRQETKRKASFKEGLFLYQRFVLSLQIRENIYAN